ncbi:gamma-glutamyltransferase family protein [Kushneria aurantia]|uniref:Gamma-glutamyltransferase family protein n=1 Tax=Kushneria aurantia TaxID=504092 RepID=A0ABV6FYW9_9GAMM|nr:gamma-glutamyltransferase [Kushneria aurantia]
MSSSLADTEQWQRRTIPVRSADGAVAAQHRVAARAGAAMLHQGGNAVDAAVACGWALAAVEPWMSGPGGSGFMVVWLAAEQRAVALDFQGVLASTLDPADYPLDPDLPDTPMGFPAVADRANTEGYPSMTLPGSVAGLEHARQRFGRLSRAQVMAPAIELAERGHPVDWFTSLQIGLAARVLARDPVSRDIYLPGGHPALPESRLHIPGLAASLKEIAATGSEGFYRGALAERMVDDLQRGGSRLSVEDFAAYRVREFDAMRAEHRGFTLYTPGEISGGERQRDMLAHSRRSMPQPPERPDAGSWLSYAAALEHCWRQHKIRRGVVTEQGGCTSSLSAADRDGNMVALTHTLLNRFGSGVTLPGSGILMNDGVSYFDPRPGYPTSMAGGQRINSSNMCPTIGIYDTSARFALGASGGDLIMPAVTQLVALMTDFGMSLEEAMHHPRLDASDRGSLRVDPRLAPQVLAQLGKHYVLEPAQQLVFPRLYACPGGVARNSSGEYEALCDPAQPVGGGAIPAPFTAVDSDRPRQGARP